MFDADGDGVAEQVYYNGFRAGETSSWAMPRPAMLPRWPDRSGPAASGIENMAATCVQGRGVMIDLHATFGPSAASSATTIWRKPARRSSVTVEPGDMVCLHTGFAVGAAGRWAATRTSRR